MELMSQATAPLRSYEPFMQVMQQMSNPLLGVLIGAVFTALVQSSSATTGIVIVMASQGLLTLETGIALVLGSNIGTCVTAFISAVGKPREAMQAATAHILFNTLGVILFIGFIPQLADFVRQMSPVSEGLVGLELLAADAPRQIANAHTVFNIANLVIFLGFTGVLAKIVLRIVPPLPPVPQPETEARFLDAMYLDQPSMALERVRLELERVGSKVNAMVRDSFPTLLVGTQDRIDALVQRDNEVDSLTDAVTLYLRELSTRDLVDPQPERLQVYLGVASYLENIADIIETGVAADSRKRLENNLDFTEETEAYIKDIYKELYQAAQATVEALIEDDREKAKAVMDNKARFNGLVEKARTNVYSRLTSKKGGGLAVYKIETSTIENFRRIHNLLRRICKLTLGAEENLKQEIEPADEDVSAHQ
jgi:phosphate:Na+ symporter